MSPTKMAVQLAKIQGEKGKKTPAPAKTIPVTPPPITPKVGAGKTPPAPTDITDPKMPLDDWMKQRDEAARASRRY